MIEFRNEASAAAARQGEKISVFVAGVQKAGTTSLFGYLSDHPALAVPSRKELHIFDDEARNWATPEFSDIETFYEAGDRDRLRVEATPITIFWPPAIARLAAYNPDARLILVFRDPIERAWSHWCMTTDRGVETLPFASAIREGRARLDLQNRLGRAWRLFSYLERGLYAEQLARLLEHFPQSQLLLLRSSDLLNDPERTLGRIADFLGIEPFDPVSARSDMRKSDRFVGLEPAPEDIGYCREYFRASSLEFQRLSGLDICT